MKWKTVIVGILAGILGILLLEVRKSNAVSLQDGGRVHHVQVDVSQYKWQVVDNQNGKALCDLVIEYNRPPTEYEMLAACANILTQSEQVTAAPGATAVPTVEVITPYLLIKNSHAVFIGVSHSTRTINIPLQDMVLDVSVPDAVAIEPYVVLTAYEPEPEYQIVAILGSINGNNFSCDGSKCRLPVSGDSSLEFWAKSSFGDESSHVKATLRRLKQADGSDTISIDALSTVNIFKDYCSEIWGSTPGNPVPGWAAFPTSPEFLHTQKDYYYLTGELIRKNLVDTSDCPSRGLLADGSPNGCGMERAHSEMIRWQNQYDTMLWTSGRQLGVPPTFLKVLIATESQFWPANVRFYLYEYGLAQLNQWGSDVALRWDHQLTRDTCNGVLSDCSLPYASLTPANQSILRGALVRAVNVECPKCQGGVDPVKSIKTVPIIARLLRSNCRQSKYIFDQYRVLPTYEDAFKFTLVSYHSGYFCLDDAIHSTISSGLPVNWTNVSGKISTGCFGGAEYVNNFWDSLESFSTYAIKPISNPADIPVVRMISIPKITPTPTSIAAHSKIRVIVYVDKNKNGRMDDGEGISNLPVQVGLENGTTFTLQTQDGSVLFEISGVAVNSNAVILLPTQFKSTSVRVPESGVVEVAFALSQTIIPPVLP